MFMRLRDHFRDHLRKSQHRHFRSKWWPLSAVYCLLLDWSIINSTICYREANPKFENRNAKPQLAAELRQFCNAQLLLPREICDKSDDVIAHIRSTVIPKRNFRDVLTARLNREFGHFPRWHPANRKCVMHKRKLRTNYFCSYCGVCLHCKYCFEVFHSVANFAEAKRAVLAVT